MEITVLLVVLIISVAFFGESIFGFGGTLISVPATSLILGVRDAITLVLIFQLLMGLLIFKSFRLIDWKTAKPISVSMIIGTIFGTLVLSLANIAFLQSLLGTFIVLFLIKMAWFDNLRFHKKSHAASIASGLGGGLLQGSIGSGGPVLIMYLSEVIKQKAVLRITLLYLFFITSIVRLGIAIPTGLFDQRIIYLGLVTLPFFLIAIAFGQRIHHNISDKYYRLCIYVVLTLTAIILFNKAL